MGKLRFAKSTTPIRRSGTKAAYAPKPPVDPVLLRRISSPPLRFIRFRADRIDRGDQCQGNGMAGSDRAVC
jgi:hypothetical protein